MEEVRAEGEDGTCKTETRPLLQSTCGASRDKHKGGGEHVEADCSKGRDADAVFQDDLQRQKRRDDKIITRMKTITLQKMPVLHSSGDHCQRAHLACAPACHVYFHDAAIRMIQSLSNKCVSHFPLK